MQGKITDDGSLIGFAGRNELFAGPPLLSTMVRLRPP